MINFKAKLPLELINYLRFTGIITGNHKHIKTRKSMRESQIIAHVLSYLITKKKFYHPALRSAQLKMNEWLGKY